MQDRKKFRQLYTMRARAKEVLQPDHQWLKAFSQLHQVGSIVV